VFAARPTTIPDEAFAVAARSLAAMVQPEHFTQGLVYPPLRTIRDTELSIAVDVATWFWQQGLAREERPNDIAHFVRGKAWTP